MGVFLNYGFFGRTLHRISDHRPVAGVHVLAGVEKAPIRRVLPEKSLTQIRFKNAMKCFLSNSVRAAGLMLLSVASNGETSITAVPYTISAAVQLNSEEGRSNDV
jgi:hypothetical protein